MIRRLIVCLSLLCAITLSAHAQVSYLTNNTSSTVALTNANNFNPIVIPGVTNYLTITGSVQQSFSWSNSTTPYVGSLTLSNVNNSLSSITMFPGVASCITGVVSLSPGQLCGTNRLVINGGQLFVTNNGLGTIMFGGSNDSDSVLSLTNTTLFVDNLYYTNYHVSFNSAPGIYINAGSTFYSLSNSVILINSNNTVHPMTLNGTWFAQGSNLMAASAGLQNGYLTNYSSGNTYFLNIGTSGKLVVQNPNSYFGIMGTPSGGSTLPLEMQTGSQLIISNGAKFEIGNCTLAAANLYSVGNYNTVTVVNASSSLVITSSVIGAVIGGTASQASYNNDCVIISNNASALFGNLTIGGRGGFTNSLIIADGASVGVQNGMVVGYFSYLFDSELNGLTIKSGGQFTGGGTMSLGQPTGGALGVNGYVLGTNNNNYITISDSGSSVTTTGNLYIGYITSPTIPNLCMTGNIVSVQNGATFTVNNMYLGYISAQNALNLGNSGSLVVNGSFLNASGLVANITVGNGGQGTLVISNGSKANLSHLLNGNVLNNAGTNYSFNWGAYAASTNGALANGSGMTLGYTQENITISTGTMVAANTLISDPGTVVNVYGILTNAQAGAASLTVSNGASCTSTGLVFGHSWSYWTNVWSNFTAAASITTNVNGVGSITTNFNVTTGVIYRVDYATNQNNNALFNITTGSTYTNIGRLINTNGNTFQVWNGSLSYQAYGVTNGSATANSGTITICPVSTLTSTGIVTMASGSTLNMCINSDTPTGSLFTTTAAFNLGGAFTVTNWGTSALGRTNNATINIIDGTLAGNFTSTNIYDPLLTSGAWYFNNGNMILTGVVSTAATIVTNRFQPSLAIQPQEALQPL